ncbi:MAG: Panacea domain-containing protein [Steroidobacteraceae bacterium]
MLISHDREKLINAIVYFARNTKFCGKTKLFKLLYLLDFHHFRQTGRSVTGLEYRAWKLGPVPIALMQEWDAREPDLAAAIDVVPEPVFDFDRLRVESKVTFDDSQFTKRELQLMRELAERHQNDMTAMLVGLTHEERGPWDKIWDGGRGNDQRIPYALAVPDDDPNRDAVLRAAAEYEAIAAADSARH